MLGARLQLALAREQKLYCSTTFSEKPQEQLLLLHGFFDAGAFVLLKPGLIAAEKDGADSEHKTQDKEAVAFGDIFGLI